ncbi:MAG: hypothetical protein V1788_03535, partial [Nanoarchaeota archaeon]
MIDEHTLKNSFRAIKADILEIQGELMNIKQEQARILVDVDIMKSVRKDKTKNVVKPRRSTYVASKEGKKFHVDTCAYAQNIKPRSKIKFKSKTT